MSLFVILFMLLPSMIFAQSGSSTDIGDTTLYISNGRSGTR